MYRDLLKFLIDERVNSHLGVLFTELLFDMTQREHIDVRDE